MGPRRPQHFRGARQDKALQEFCRPAASGPGSALAHLDTFQTKVRENDLENDGR
jgi:hypothetical protein